MQPHFRDSGAYDPRLIAEDHFLVEHINVLKPSLIPPLKKLVLRCWCFLKLHGGHFLLPNI